ncbi:MAG: helix-turn-helix transcriptional regulator [Peptostreptococcaceae bacterium]
MFIFYENLIAIPVGVTIKQELKFSKMNLSTFKNRMGMTQREIRDLMKGDTRITNEIALKLSDIFGIPAHFWLRYDSIFLEQLAEINDRKNSVNRNKKLQSEK